MVCVCSLRCAKSLALMSVLCCVFSCSVWERLLLSWGDVFTHRDTEHLNVCEYLKPGTSQAQKKTTL